MFVIFLKSVLLGVFVTAPVGPIGILVVKKSLAGRWGLAISAGLGAAVVDGFFSIVAGLGLTQVSTFLLKFEKPLSGLGALILVILLWIFEKRRRRENQTLGHEEKADQNFLKTAPDKNSSKIKPKGNSKLEGFRNFSLSAFITFTNPMTIVGFAGLFVVFGLIGVESGLFLIPIGVFLGACLWWGSLTFLVFRMRGKLTGGFVNRIHIATHVLMALSASVCVYRFVF